MDCKATSKIVEITPEVGVELEKIDVSKYPEPEDDGKNQARSRFFGIPMSSANEEIISLMIALAIPVFLETLDYTVVATSQTHIASAFNALDQQTYIGTVYLLTSTVFLPFFASVADIYGRHFAMQTSLLFFLFGSALSTGANNMATMLAGRGIAGIGAAGLLTVVRVVMADSASLNANNRLAAAFFLLYSAGFSAGPAIGGALLTVSFRWVFAINLPACALSMALAFLLLRKYAQGPIIIPVSGRTGKKSSGLEDISALNRLLALDWIGAFLFVTGGILFLLGLNWGANAVWNSAKVVVCLILGPLLFILCLIWEYTLERRREEDLRAMHEAESAVTSEKSDAKPAIAVYLNTNYEGWRRVWIAVPMIPFGVLFHFDVFATEFAAFTSGMVMLVIFYFVAIFMVVVNGLSAVQAGVQLIYFAPGMGGGTILAMVLIKRLRQPKLPIILGTNLIPIALGMLSSAVHLGQQGAVNGYMVMAGVGVGMGLATLAMHARFSQPPERVAIVIALNLFFRSFGGTVGLAQCATILSAKVRASLAHLESSGTDLSSLIPSEPLSPNSASFSSLAAISSLPPELQDAVREAFREGIRWCFISLVPWCAVAFILCRFLSLIDDSDCSKDKPEGADERPVWERRQTIWERLRFW